MKVITKNECANDLRPEDIEFLNAVPDYEAVGQKIATLSEKVEIVKHKCHQMKVAANDRVTKTSLDLYETKKRLCGRLNADKEFNRVLNSFNDSGNYSIDDSSSNLSNI